MKFTKIKNKVPFLNGNLMKIIIHIPKLNSPKTIDAFNKETALALMEHLQIKREQLITLFSQINKDRPRTFRARKKLLQLVDWFEENNENTMMQINRARSLFTISPIKDAREPEEGAYQIISIEYIKRKGYIRVQKINSTLLPLEIRFKLKSTSRPVAIRKKKKKEKSTIPNVDSMMIDALRKHQNIYFKDYAEIISILNKNTTLNKSPSTNLRNIHCSINLTKVASLPKTPSQITEIIINTKGKQRYYYLISNGKHQYLIQEKGIARQLHFNRTFVWMFVINKIQMAFTETTGYLNQELGLTLEKNNSGYREAITNVIKDDNTFLRKNKRKWREACNIKVLWGNHNSKETEIIPLNRTVITYSIHESQNYKDTHDDKNHIGHNNIESPNAIQKSNSLKPRIDNILLNLRNPKKNE